MFVGKSKNVWFGGVSGKLNNEIISTVSEFKCLGVVIDSNLKWEKHFNPTINESARTTLITLYVKLFKKFFGSERLPQAT